MQIQRESIFISAMRAFCKMFFGLCGLLLAFILVSAVYSAFSETTTIETKTKIKYLSDAANQRELVAETAPVILQINVHGVIGQPKSMDTEVVQNILVESRTGKLKDNRVKAIFLHMNTPGGTIIDSDNIYHMLKVYKEKYKVPIYAYVDGLCASGGMYIACAADRIFSGSSSIIGSVGVLIGPFFNVFETMTKMGIKSETITQGLHKDMMSPFRQWKDDEDISLKNLSSFFYRQFVDIIAHNRPRIDKTKLVDEYGAQVFDPITAQQLGYIDVANSSRNVALLELLTAAQIDPSKPYQVVTLEPKTEWLADLFNEESPVFTGVIKHTIDTGHPNIKEKVAYLYWP